MAGVRDTGGSQGLPDGSSSVGGSTGQSSAAPATSLTWKQKPQSQWGPQDWEAYYNEAMGQNGPGNSSYAPYDLGGGHTKWEEDQLQAQENAAKLAQDKALADQQTVANWESQMEARKGPNDPYGYLYSSRGLTTPDGYKAVPQIVPQAVLDAAKAQGIDLSQYQAQLNAPNNPQLNGYLGALPPELNQFQNPMTTPGGAVQGAGNPLVGPGTGDLGPSALDKASANGENFYGRLPNAGGGEPNPQAANPLLGLLGAHPGLASFVTSHPDFHNFIGSHPWFGGSPTSGANPMSATAPQMNQAPAGDMGVNPLAKNPTPGGAPPPALETPPPAIGGVGIPGRGGPTPPPVAPTPVGSSGAPAKLTGGTPADPNAPAPPMPVSQLDPYTKEFTKGTGIPGAPSAQQVLATGQNPADISNPSSSGLQGYKNYVEKVAGGNWDDIAGLAKNLYPKNGAAVASGYQ